MNQDIISQNDQAPVIQTVTWLLLVISILAFLAHAGIKLYISRPLNSETVLMFLSLISGCGESTCVILQAGNGFGRPMMMLQKSQLLLGLKYEYAGKILFIFSLGLSKFAIIAFIHNLTMTFYRKLNIAVGGFSALWLFLSVLVVAFQCNIPNFWDRLNGNCIDQFAWWHATSILNIVSEVAIVFLEVWIASRLQIPPARKIGITGIFTCRLSVSIALVVQLCIFREEYSGSKRDDLTLGYWRSCVAAQVVQCLGIVTTSLPYTKFFMESFESGLLRIDDMRRREEHNTKDGSGRSYELLDASRNSERNVIKQTKTWEIKSTPIESSATTVSSIG